MWLQHWSAQKLSGSSYLLARSPGQLISVKNIHQQNTTQIQITWNVGWEASLAFSFSPAIVALNFINDICSSHKLYLIWGKREA